MGESGTKPGGRSPVSMMGSVLIGPKPGVAVVEVEMETGAEAVALGQVLGQVLVEAVGHR